MRLRERLMAPGDIASLAAFRIFFGLMMALGGIRFTARGWVHELYIAPELFFPYWGLEWVRPLPGIGMYLVFTVLILAALGVACGLFYRLSATTFFLVFTYVELLDKTNYLNHYYFVSLVALLMIFLPAHHAFSLDVRFGRVARRREVPAWTIWVIRATDGDGLFFCRSRQDQSGLVVGGATVTDLATGPPRHVPDRSIAGATRNGLDL